VLTAPGQTAAVSGLIEPMLGGLGSSRTALSTAYLVGTLTGAAAMPLVRRASEVQTRLKALAGRAVRLAEGAGVPD
jgi:hypothetical protein